MTNAKIISVTFLNNYLKNLFEGDVFLSRVYIKGEISNLNKHYTGHYYFTLKDENSKISCMMFSSYTKSIKFELNNGDEVLIFGKVTTYDKNGTYQLYVYNIEQFGLGKYLLQLQELKAKLKLEGIFDKEKKRINLYPKKIGIVTSKTGAAVKDIIHTITNRFPCEIIIFPCLVQGEEAPKSIIKSLSKADASDIDTIILARGGGANEDLKAFNDEELVRFASTLKKPLITAIGHQIDSSLIDLVSDIACITPTEAGEKSCANKIDIYLNIKNIINLSKSLIDNRIKNKENLLLNLISIIDANKPKDKLISFKKQVNHQLDLIRYSMKLKLNQINQDLNELNYSLNIHNPRLALDKGYALIFKDKKRIINIDEINYDDDIDILLLNGTIKAKVKEIDKNGK